VLCFSLAFCFFKKGNRIKYIPFFPAATSATSKGLRYQSPRLAAKLAANPGLCYFNFFGVTDQVAFCLKKEKYMQRAKQAPALQ
jgi:hypothetical protein